MDVSGVSSSIIDSVVNTASKEAPGAAKALGNAQDIRKQAATQVVESIPEPREESAPDPDSRVGRNIDVKA